jgi:hypothetical protein
MRYNWSLGRKVRGPVGRAAGSDVRGEWAADSREGVRGTQEGQEAADAVLRAKEYPVGGHTTGVLVGDVHPPSLREARAVVE